MRRSVVRHAAVVGSTALLLLTPLGLLGAPANAEPVAPNAPIQLSADQLPPQLVEAVQRDLHISPQEYLDRAAKAQELGAYAREFRAERPASFAGAWMGQDGRPVVAVTSNEAAQIASRDGYLTKLAPISADNLEYSLAQLNQWVSSLPRQVSGQVQSVSLDVLDNQVVIDIINTPWARALNLPTLIANLKVVLTPGGGGPVEHTPMGGDTYVTAPGPLATTPPSHIAVCSFGFNAADVHGNPLNISAGHCDPNVGKSGGHAAVYVPNPSDLPASPQAGEYVHSSLGDTPAGLDYSVIKLNARAVRAGMDKPHVRGVNGTTLNITGTAVPVIGAPICKSGQTSTFTCGQVAADRVEAQLFTDTGESKIVHGFASTACTLAGDSGGAIVTGTMALGITSGSNAASAPDCNEANLTLAPDGGTASLGIPIRDILADTSAHSGGGIGSGIQVRTAPIRN